MSISFRLSDQRTVLHSVLLATCIISSGCNGGGSSESFESPSEINGGLTLNAEIVISEQQNKVGDLEFTAMVYNGDYAAPVIRIDPGGSMKLRLVNLAPQQPSNIHTHGLNVSPQGNSDNVFVQVEPENCFDYSIQVPESQDVGLNWYHSHMMGLAETQVFNGLSGGLIINGVAEKMPFLNGVKERIMILKDVQANADGTVTTPDYSKPTLRTINGVSQPSINLGSGETQFWRVGNMGANLFYRIAVDGHQRVEILRDGNTRTRPLTQDSILLPPGARTEFLITGGAPGTYQFRTLAVNTGPDGDPTPEDILGTVVVSGGGKTVVAPATLVDHEDLRSLEIARNRRIVFSENNDAGQFFINNQLYNPDRDDVVVPLGSVEKWDIINNSEEMHTFHIHQTDFQVISRNGQSEEFFGYQDTVNVDPGGRVSIIISFTKQSQVGRFVFHCHILEHEDGGMMQNIVVFDPANPGAVDNNRMLQGKPCG